MLFSWFLLSGVYLLAISRSNLSAGNSLSVHFSLWLLLLGPTSVIIYVLSMLTTSETSCRRAAATICHRPYLPPWAPKRRRADGNVAAVSRGQTFPRPPLQPPDAPTRRLAKRPGDLDLESGVWVNANFSLPRPLCSRLRPDVRDRQTSDSIIDLCPAY